MYEVILIDNDNNRVGEIGVYDSEREANSEANNYNRKSDRHRGYAVVQAIIGQDHDYDSDSEDLPVVRVNPERRPRIQRTHGDTPARSSVLNLRERMRAKNQDPQFERKTVLRQRPPEPEPEPEPDFEFDSESEFESESEEAPIDSVKRSVSTVSPEPYEKEHVLIYDRVKDSHLVLQDGFFTRHMLLSGADRYEVLSKGSFYDMIQKRSAFNTRRQR